MILDLFAGPGGWSEGLRQLGLRDVGIEIDRWACATRAAAGHATIRADVAVCPPQPFQGRVRGLIASPPCKDFSRSGKRRGLAGATGRLVFEVMRWAEVLRPAWIACEQVPDVLPIWQEFAWRLRTLDYSTWAGLLNAADYGVPQTRVRAFLLAHRERPALPPEPTHCKGGAPSGLFGSALLPWVSMAEALGWDGGTLHTDRPAPALTGKAGGQWELRNNTNANACLRPLDEPAGTLFSGGHLNDVSWVFVNGNQPHAARRGPHEPAPTIAFGHNAERVEWVAERPSTTVCGGPRIGRPGHKDRESGEAQFAEESVRVSLEEAAMLQGFRPDHPFQGTKTACFEQVGNAVPPPLAAAIIGVLELAP